MTPTKRKLVGIVAVVTLMIVLGGFLIWKQSASWFKKEAPTEKKKQTIEQTNVIPVSERPYLQLSPTADGRNVIILVKALKKQADTMEYLLEYETGSLLQGVQGELSLATIPAQTQQLLGSCSAGGKCTYHEDVSGGKLETYYRGSADYKLRQEWRFFNNKTKETSFASRDGKFQVTSSALGQQKFIIILNSPGYPPNLVGTPASDPYALAVSQTLSGTADITIRASQEAENLVIQGWDGSNWQQFESTITDKMVVATNVPLMELYIVTAQ